MILQINLDRENERAVLVACRGCNRADEEVETPSKTTGADL